MLPEREERNRKLKDQIKAVDRLQHQRLARRGEDPLRPLEQRYLSAAFGGNSISMLPCCPQICPYMRASLVGRHGIMPDTTSGIPTVLQWLVGL